MYASNGSSIQGSGVEKFGLSLKGLTAEINPKSRVCFGYSPSEPFLGNRAQGRCKGAHRTKAYTRTFLLSDSLFVVLGLI